MNTNIEQRVISYYINDRLSADKISSLESINRKTVFRILKKHNIKSRTLSEAAMKYQCDDHYFSSIDTSEKAYWLGALFADGNISKKASKSGQIFFSSVDKEWVEKFMWCIRSTNKPRSEYHVKYNKYIWKAQITSSTMYNDLERLGCSPCKSKIIRLPKLSNNCIHHFIRGYFDGDGTVGVYKNLKSHSWKILKSGFCSGSKEFLQDILKILPVKNKNISHHNVYIVQFSLNDTIKLYNYMYSDTCIYLSRKREVFDNYFLTYNPRKRFNDYNK